LREILHNYFQQAFRALVRRDVGNGLPDDHSSVTSECYLMSSLIAQHGETGRPHNEVVTAHRFLLHPLKIDSDPSSWHGFD
jgi:hypothetical protein